MYERLWCLYYVTAHLLSMLWKAPPPPPLPLPLPPTPRDTLPPLVQSLPVPLATSASPPPPRVPRRSPRLDRSFVVCLVLPHKTHNSHARPHRGRSVVPSLTAVASVWPLPFPPVSSLAFSATFRFPANRRSSFFSASPHRSVSPLSSVSLSPHFSSSANQLSFSG